MKKQFEKFGLNISEIEVNYGVTVKNCTELLEDNDTAERVKRDAFSAAGSTCRGDG